MRTLPPEDDLRHDLSRSAYGRESLFWVLPLPEDELLLLVYAWLHPDGSCGRFVAVAGDDPRRPAFFDLQDRCTFGGEDLDDCEIAGLQVRLPELLRRSQLRFAADGVALDLDFEALHAPFSYRDNPDGCPAWLADDRFEQSVAVTGELTVDGRAIAVDTTAHRDHSWGTRDWAVLHQWKWINVQQGRDHALNAYTNVVMGETAVNGYLFRDGEVAPLVDVDARADYGPDLHQTGLHARFTDAEGRTATLEGRRNTALHIDFGDAAVVNETAGLGTLDGQDAPFLFEIGWDGAYIKRLMSRDDNGRTQ